MATVEAVELIVSGNVQGVGYRGFVTRIARKLKLIGFAENLEDGTLRILCKGEVTSIGKFKELINVKNPPQAPLIEVEAISEKPLKPEEIAETVFKEKFGEVQAEMSQWQMTGLAYLNAGFNQLGNKIDSGFGRMDKNFESLGNKIDNVSKELVQFRTESNSNFQGLGKNIDNGFNKMGDKIDNGFNKTEANFGVLAVKYGKISTTLERMDKNLEKMANRKKGIF